MTRLRTLENIKALHKAYAGRIRRTYGHDQDVAKYLSSLDVAILDELQPAINAERDEVELITAATLGPDYPVSISRGRV